MLGTRRFQQLGLGPPRDRIQDGGSVFIEHAYRAVGDGAGDAWLDGRRQGMHFEADEYRELDDEHVLVMFRFKGHGKASGLPLDAIHPTGAHLFRVRSGKVVQLVAYFDREHALADLGLAPEGGSPP